MSLKAKGDPIANLYEDIAAEEKARTIYQWIIDLSRKQIRVNYRFLCIQ
ncbi:Manganese containing catalase [Virgibacillus chiguensis]|uniref:Manganese containing catalase n=1 Tax=Virgibacillus chiguensis TaxID=411959 RepID=A0A1M5L5U4_9BACI|nr:Manganese containing catalase [Virgibacillus chiguensis]